MKITRFHFMHTLLLQFVALFMCSVAIGSMPNPAPAAEDDYLKALEAEARNSAKLNKQAPSTGKNSKTVNTSNSVKPKSKEKQLRVEFEQTLANERPATYSFYKKLPESDKSSVLDTYKESKKISTTSKKIFDLYFALTKK